MIPFNILRESYMFNMFNFKKKSRLNVLTGSVLLLLTVSNAQAESDTAVLGSNPPLEDAWHFNLGAGAMSAPRYPGSSDQKLRALPIFGATYDRYFIGSGAGDNSPFGLGAYLFYDSHWRLGAALSYDMISPRKESDDTTHLHGLGDIDRTAHATLFGSYTRDWFNARSSISTDIGGKHQGTLATFDLEGRYQPIERLTLSAGPGLTWGSSQYNQTFFGVNARQSAQSGLAAYSPGSGITFRVSAGANYQLTRNWGLGARVTASRFQGDIADSPIVDDKTQVNYGIFANYRF
jgi:outer membrane scaffolding protein for murein synthesis (MipA/OmpV family)